MDFFNSFTKLADSFTNSVQGLLDQKIPPLQEKYGSLLSPWVTLPTNSVSNGAQIDQEWILVDEGSLTQNSSESSGNFLPLLSKSIDVWSPGSKEEKLRFSSDSHRSYNFPSSSESYDQTWTEGDSSDTINTDLFLALLKETRVQMVKVSEYAWKTGIPASQRPLLWKMLVGYYTPWPHSNPTLTKMKREFYSDNYLLEHMKKPRKQQLRAVRSDLRLVSYYFKFFQSPQIQQMLERVIYILFCESLFDVYPVGLAQIAIAPLYVILTEYQNDLSSPLSLDEAQLSKIESDLYCMIFSLFQKSSKEMFENPMKFASYVEKIVKSVDPSLHEFLISNDVEFLTLVHEWLVKMLFPIFRKLPLIVLLWDRYMVASDQFWNFHACVCAALIVYFSKKVKTLDDARQVYEFFSELQLDGWESYNMAKFVSFACGVAEGAGVWEMVHDNWMMAMRMKKEKMEEEVSQEEVDEKEEEKD